MSLTKWLIPLEWASQCSKKETPGCSFLSPARPPHQGRSSSSSSQRHPWYQSKPFCITPEALKSFFLSPSRSEMFDRTKSPTSRPDSNRSSHPAFAQGAHHGRWTWVVDLASSYYVLKNDTQNMFFSCSWNYHFLPPVSDASANLLAYIFDAVQDKPYISVPKTPNFKVVQSGKNGSKRPMLSISMAFNVISCKKSWKKHSKTQNRWFYNVNSAPEPRNDQKSSKKRNTKSRFTQFFV